MRKMLASLGVRLWVSPSPRIREEAERLARAAAQGARLVPDPHARRPPDRRDVDLPTAIITLLCITSDCGSDQVGTRRCINYETQDDPTTIVVDARAVALRRQF